MKSGAGSLSAPAGAQRRFAWMQQVKLCVSGMFGLVASALWRARTDQDSSISHIFAPGCWSRGCCEGVTRSSMQISFITSRETFPSISTYVSLIQI